MSSIITFTFCSKWNPGNGRTLVVQRKTTLLDVVFQVCSSPPPEGKNIHNLPKTPPYQDFPSPMFCPRNRFHGKVPSMNQLCGPHRGFIPDTSIPMKGGYWGCKDLLQERVFKMSWTSSKWLTQNYLIVFQSVDIRKRTPMMFQCCSECDRMGTGTVTKNRSWPQLMYFV